MDSTHAGHAGFRKLTVLLSERHLSFNQNILSNGSNPIRITWQSLIIAQMMNLTGIFRRGAILSAFTNVKGDTLSPVFLKNPLKELSIYSRTAGYLSRWLVEP